MRQFLRPRAIVATSIGWLIGYVVVQHLPLPRLWCSFIAFAIGVFVGPLILKILGEPDPA